MKKENKKLLFACLSILLFYLLIILIKNMFFDIIDSSVSSFFSHMQFVFGIKYFNFITNLASPVALAIIFFITFIIVYKKKSSKKAYFYLINFFATIGSAYVIKEIIKRARPINPFETNFSFPSMHVVGAITVFGSIAYLYWNNKKIAYSMLALILLVSISRLYLNVHWFTDVIGSLFYGTALLLFISWAFFDKNFFGDLIPKK